MCSPQLQRLLSSKSLNSPVSNGWWDLMSHYVQFCSRPPIILSLAGASASDPEMLYVTFGRLPSSQLWLSVAGEFRIPSCSSVAGFLLKAHQKYNNGQIWHTIPRHGSIHVTVHSHEQTVALLVSLCACNLQDLTTSREPQGLCTSDSWNLLVL